MTEPKEQRRAAPWLNAQVKPGASIPKDVTPRGGPFDMPAIPRIDEQPVLGRTMADNAKIQQARAMNTPQMPPLQMPASPQPSIVQQEGGTQQHQGPQILPNDLLPDEAKADPAFMTGFGSVLAMYQPNLALKYGVMRGGQKIPGQALMPGVANQSNVTRTHQDSVKDFQQLMASDPYAPKKEGEEGKGPPKKELSPEEATKKEEEENKAVESVIKSMDDYDFDSFRRQLERDNLNNPEQKAIIEARLQPLDMNQLIMHDRVEQLVPIIPGKFEVMFVSSTAEEDLEIKRLMTIENKKTDVSDNYLLQKYAIMMATIGTQKIQGNPLPPHTDAEGNFDEKRFAEKLRWMLRRPLHMLASIGCNHAWFELRVRGMFEAKKLGNG
jgi:hypothetical protein